ncbi:MAG: hypothetical protein GY749_02220 [Desulfobacteraceae bacterium]|nr:hypothetical protein [Desulfobacteraceae bacterium]
MNSIEKSSVNLPLFKKSTVADFCRDYGYSPSTVYSVIHRHLKGGGCKRLPYGPKTRKIISDLTKHFELKERKSA